MTLRQRIHVRESRNETRILSPSVVSRFFPHPVGQVDSQLRCCRFLPGGWALQGDRYVQHVAENARMRDNLRRAEVVSACFVRIEKGSSIDASADKLSRCIHLSIKQRYTVQKEPIRWRNAGRPGGT